MIYQLQKMLNFNTDCHLNFREMKYLENIFFVMSNYDKTHYLH